MLEKNYLPKENEKKQYDRWVASKAFESGRRSADPYTIMMPPANVTGTLHLGHALTFTIQDTLVRYQRMRGKDVLWQPGVDHAGIATQMVVERQLAEEGITRQDLGREKFVDKVWEWKEKSGGEIISQLKRLGASADWQRERFTMDEGLSKAVSKVFVELYKQGLLYRDKRLVNWDPKLKTAISNLEVENKESTGTLWYIQYPLDENPDESITVATTRPETLLGDTAVAVHPDDERYQHLIGKKVRLPLCDRLIPVVADEYSDMEKGSGAVKITPAHDFNDFEVGKRHDLPFINIFDESAVTNENVPEAFRGLERFDARKKILEALKEQGFLVKEETIQNAVPYGDRSGVMIEPWLTDQWYVDAKTLAQPAIKAVEEGKIKFVPEQWAATYFEWLRNIEPWCVSRQIWWGHSIPAWYGPDGKVFVAQTEKEACAQAKEAYGSEVELTQDNDVLDTWFSSALWPFSTLGWPEQTPELAKYYPTDVLVTGFDIIFFWVARMIMFGLHFMGDVPFKTVYIHALVRDEKGQKMSKSKGNVIDPLDLIDEMGTDALRFSINMLAAQGRDIRLSAKVVETYRNFITKLWNASRYLEMNECKIAPEIDLADVKEPLNQWMVYSLRDLSQKVSDGLNAHKFNEASSALYHFVWGTFCDWYLELSKPILQGEDQAAILETRRVMGWALGKLLHLLHPFIPYVTEQIWEELNEESVPGLLIESLWPTIELGDQLTPTFAQGQKEIQWVIDVISNIRTARGEMNVPPAVQAPAFIHGLDDEKTAWVAHHETLIKRMARLKELTVSKENVAKGAMSILVPGATVAVPLAEVIDIEVEKERLEKEISKVDEVITMTQKKLSNKNFVDRAPKEVVDEHNERLEVANVSREKLEKALQRIAAL